MEGRVMGIYIKRFKPQDGLYVIKDGVIRKYKAKGGTVRPYELIEVKEPNERERAMTDTISRQAAIDALREEVELEYDEKDEQWYYIEADMAIGAIERLPSAQPEQRWIPCSERLPEENEVVLTQARFSDDIKMAVSARIDYNYWTGWGTREVNVVAWMPLPKPWKGDK